MNANPRKIDTTAKVTPVPAAAAVQAAPETPVAPAPRRKGRRRALMLALPLALAAGGGAWWLTGGRYVTTENAYVHQPMITVSTDVSGRVTEVLIRENQQVEAGTPLFRLDQEAFRIAMNQSEAAVAAARLQVAQLRAAYATAEAQLDAAKGIEAVQHREIERQQALTAKGIGSQSALDNATVTARSAHNAVAVAQAQLDAAAAALGGDPSTPTDDLPSVKAAIAAQDAARRNLDKTEVRAPVSGAVAQVENLNVGQFLSAGAAAATLVDGGDTWIEANFKETQLDGLKPGQPVEIEVDAYPGMALHGTLDSFGSATGSQFSLIPAQNATGNWVKVVQRVPVRIRLDAAPARPLLDGMSVQVSVDTGHSRLDELTTRLDNLK